VPDDGKAVRYDVAIPRLRLIFEFHGVQHYKLNENVSFGSEASEISLVDQMKRRLAEKHGYTLIEVWAFSLSLPFAFRTDRLLDRCLIGGIRRLNHCWQQPSLPVLRFNCLQSTI